MQKLMVIPFIFFPLFGMAEPFVAGLNAMDREHYATAFRAWKKLADVGEAEAENNIGFLYERGHGVKQSYARAIQWYTKAADQGLPEAKHNLGMLAFHGYGMEQNYLKARRQFTAAAELDLGIAAYMMGLIFYKGHGVAINEPRAREWFLEAASNGSPEGQFMASYMFQAGEGHPKQESEPLKAYIWATVALKNGYAEAQSIIDFARIQFSDVLEVRAQELADRCLTSGYEKCPS